MKPCLAEEWFIEDTCESIDKLCKTCRSIVEHKLSLYGKNRIEALSSIYDMSRSIRVMKFMSGKTEEARKMGNWEVVKVMNTIEALIGFSQGNYISMPS